MTADSFHAFSRRRWSAIAGGPRPETSGLWRPRGSGVLRRLVWRSRRGAQGAKSGAPERHRGAANSRYINPHHARTTCCDRRSGRPFLRAVGSVRMARGRVVCSAKAHSRSNTQAGPAARQAGKQAKRERIRTCRTACIFRLSRISRSERSEGMRFAPQTTLPPAPPRFAQPEAGCPRVSHLATY